MRFRVNNVDVWDQVLVFRIFAGNEKRIVNCLLYLVSRNRDGYPYVLSGIMLMSFDSSFHHTIGLDNFSYMAEA